MVERVCGRLVEHAPVALVTLGCDGRVLCANPEARRLVGADPAGRGFGDLFVPDDRALAVGYLARLMAAPAGSSVFFEGAACRRDGSTAWVEVRGAALPAGEDGCWAVVLHDATEAHGLIEQMRRRALEDPLTGLANRTLLLERLSTAYRAGRSGAVVFLDLDQFKAVNDTHGHSNGDVLLVETGRRLTAVAPAGSTVARLGGDEFIVLLPGCQLPVAEAVAEAVMAAVRRPVNLDGVTVVVTASAGIAGLDVPSAEAVLRNADIALYEAKAAGRAQVRTYGPDSQAYARGRRDLMRQVTALRERNEELVAQALTDALTGLPNRRAFDEALAALDAASRRADRPYAVAYFDLDHFHDVNRAFDDDAGDATLHAVADALAAACRAGDVVYRKGGEELVALLPDTDLAAAHATAQRLADVVRDLRLPSGRDDRPVVTISGGVAALDVAMHPTAAAVVADANHAMLLAKRAGRDRVLPQSDPERSRHAG